MTTENCAHISGFLESLRNLCSPCCNLRSIEAPKDPTIATCRLKRAKQLHQSSPRWRHSAAARDFVTFASSKCPRPPLTQRFASSAAANPLQFCLALFDLFHWSYHCRTGSITDFDHMGDGDSRENRSWGGRSTSKKGTSACLRSLSGWESWSLDSTRAATHLPSHLPLASTSVLHTRTDARESSSPLTPSGSCAQVAVCQSDCAAQGQHSTCGGRHCLARDCCD